VQGVGFRPFVHRLARRFRLTGYVANDSAGAVIEVEGPAARVERFVHALRTELPPLAHVAALERSVRPARGDPSFRIRRSRRRSAPRAEVTPDAATCADCLRELSDPADRRCGHPFVNCTNCGPRYSIIHSIPYDRPATTMAGFEMCAACRREYRDPADRRFHAQPIACPQCGPRLRLVDALGGALAGDPVESVAALLGEGKIVAVKGIGGYHLACDARSARAVRRLRTRKLRDGKPLALMVRDVDAARRICRLSDAEVEALASPAAPIVLARKRRGARLARSVAPACADFGVMLPNAPVHHLLFAAGAGPLVMTSANLSGEPLTYQDDAALRDLCDVADAFLVHDRPIERPIDDSVVFACGGAVTPLRRARGYVPAPIRIGAAVRPAANGCNDVILAVGAELKSTACLLSGGEALVSEHLGDLTHPSAYRHFRGAIERLAALFALRPTLVAHDLHPQYLSTAYAAERALPRVAVQHHHAHIASVMAECGEDGPLVGVACDGAGYGVDGAVWGCELLRCAGGEFERVGQLEYFPLIGGDAAAVQTWRPALAMLRAAYGAGWMRHVASLAPGVWERLVCAAGGALPTIEKQIVARVNCPPTSSLGRVFDGVAFLLGLCERNRHEAQAAMALEAAALEAASVAPLAAEIEIRDARIVLSPRGIIDALLRGVSEGVPRGRLAAMFHEGVTDLLAAGAVRACADAGVRVVALSGGCFANRLLLAGLTARLESAGLRVLRNRLVPPGDGGVSLGQAYVALWRGRGKAASGG